MTSKRVSFDDGYTTATSPTVIPGTAVQTYANLAAFPGTGTPGILYLADDTKILYTYNGSYVVVSASWGSISGTLSAQTDLQTALNELQSDIDTRALTTNGSIITPSRLGMKKDTLANLQTYASTAIDGQLCFATDTKATYVVKNSSLSSVGGAGAGINYILAPDADSGIGLWATYKNASGAATPDGTITGTANSTFAVSASTALRGTSNFLFTKNSGASRIGEGFYYPFTIDPSDKGKVLQCSFEYQIDSGTFVDDAMEFFIWDVTNSRLIAPAPSKLKNSGIIEKFAFEFQSSIDSTSYRLFAHIGVATDSSNTIRFDNFILGPQAKLYGSATTDWVSYAPNMSSTGILTNSGRWRRVGDTMEVECYVEWNGSGGGGGLLLDIPAGFSIDAAKLSLSTGSRLGDGQRLDSGVAYYELTVAYSDSNSVRFMQTSGGAYLAGADFTAGDQLKANFRVPIVGWSSSQVMSSDADTRVVALTATTLSATAITNVNAGTTKLAYGTVVSDTHGGYNSSTGDYTVKVPGKYKITAQDYVSFASGAQIHAIYKNSSALFYGQYQFGSTGGIQAVSGIADFVAGDVISIRSFQQSGSGTATWGNSNISDILQIERISGPAQIAASESVVCNYVTTAGQSIPNNTVTTVLYGTKIHDSHNAYNTSTGIFTAPMSGVYTISASIDYTPNNTTGYRAIHAVGNLIDRTLLQMNALSIYQQVAGSTTFRLLAGQTINVYAVHTKGSSETLTASDASNYMSIYRIGNY